MPVSRKKGNTSPHQLQRQNPQNSLPPENVVLVALHIAKLFQSPVRDTLLCHRSYAVVPVVPAQGRRRGYRERAIESAAWECTGKETRYVAEGVIANERLK